MIAPLAYDRVWPRAFAVVAFSCDLAATALGQRTILAVGAHAGDVELTSGALLAKEHRR